MRLPETKNDIDSGVAVLVITQDSDLCAMIRETVSAWKWTVRQQFEIFADPGAIKLPEYPIVIYDGDSTGGDWKEALRKLRTIGSDPCILLASRVYDQYLWNEVVRCGGFDVIAKSAGCEHLIRTLRFAWFWKKNSQNQRSELLQRNSQYR